MANKPNVIVFFTDQQRWDCMAAHGNPLGITPNLDRAAQHGTHVYNSFTCQPVCGPARACLQTGMYASETGVYRNGIGLNPDHKTLAQCFNDAGYHTGYIGKWHLATTGRGFVPVKARGGYQYWLAANALEGTSDTYDCVVYDHDNQEVKLPGYRVDALTDAAIRYVDEHQSDPFYLFISFLEPHHQNHLDDYPPPDGYREMYAGRWTPPDLEGLPTHPSAEGEYPGAVPTGGSTQQHLGGYWGMIKRLDEAYGRLLDALKSLGLLEDTIVLFTSDHACHFRTRNKEYKRSCHESSIRVPTVLTGGPFTGGGTLGELVSLVDLPPSLLDGAGLEIPGQMSGRSVLPILGGGGRSLADPWPDDVFVQISESGIGRAVRTKRWKYAVQSDAVPPGAEGARSYEEAYLYDLEADPYELRNLIGYESHRPVADRMKARLLGYIRDVEGYVPEIVDAEERQGGQRRVSDVEVES